jgi:hypothetical protein
MVPESFRTTGKAQEWFLKVSGEPEMIRNGSRRFPANRKGSGMVPEGFRITGKARE